MYRELSRNKGSRYNSRFQKLAFSKPKITRIDGVCFSFSLLFSVYVAFSSNWKIITFVKNSNNGRNYCVFSKLDRKATPAVSAVRGPLF
jgi:hypothetical protein